MIHKMAVTLSREGNNLTLLVECSSKLASDKMHSLLKALISNLVSESNKS